MNLFNTLPLVSLLDVTAILNNLAKKITFIYELNA